MTAMKIAFSFSVSMFGALLFFMLGAESVGSDKTCRAMAVLIHYFVLSTMSW